MVNKIGLGTVQLGGPYGLANLGGVTCDEARQIIRLASGSGIKTLDTAVGYGSSEAVLGKIGVNEFSVVTKLPAIPSSCSSVSVWVDDQVEKSLGRLKLNKVYALLLHRPQDLFGPFGDELVTKIINIRDSGVVSKIGVSIYDPGDLEAICAKIPVELVQAPVNVIDRRIEISGWLDRLRDDGVEIHARSVFLQGLLLTERCNVPNKFSRWGYLWDNWHEKLRELRVSPLEACLAYPLSLQQVDRVIVGVDSMSQLQQILIALSHLNYELDTSFMMSGDANLVNPSNWNEL